MSLRSDVRKYYIFRALVKRFILPVIVVFMIDRGLLPSEIAFITTLGILVSFLFEVPSGAIADTIGHRRALVLSMIGQSISMLLYLGGTFEWILVATILYLFSGSFLTGTGEALLFERLKEEGKEKDFAKYQGEGKSFAAFIGIAFMAFAGVAYEYVWFLPFFIGCAQFIVAAVVISSFHTADRSVSVSRREGYLSIFSHFGQSVKMVKKDSRVFWLMLMGAAIMGPTFALADFQQILMTGAGITAVGVGLVYAAKRLTTVLASSAVHVLVKRFSPSVVFGIFICAAGVNFIFPTLFENQWLIGLAILFGGVIVSDIAISHYLNQIIPSGSRATTLSLSNLIQTTLQISSAAAFSVLSAFVLPEVTFRILGVAVLVITVGVLFGLSTAYAKAHTS